MGLGFVHRKRRHLSFAPTLRGHGDSQTVIFFPPKKSALPFSSCAMEQANSSVSRREAKSACHMHKALCMTCTNTIPLSLKLGGSVAGREVAEWWRQQLSFSLAMAVEAWGGGGGGGSMVAVVAARQQCSGGKQCGGGVCSAVLAAVAWWQRWQSGGGSVAAAGRRRAVRRRCR